MKYQQINIKPSRQPIHVLMDIPGGGAVIKATEQGFQGSDDIQARAAAFLNAISMIKAWAAVYNYRHDYDVVSAEDAPQTLEDLRSQYESTGQIGIQGCGSSSHLWDDSVNHALRHAHNMDHIKYDLGMGVDDEIFLADVLAERIAASCAKSPTLSRMLPRYSQPIIDMIYTIILTDFAAQARYYAKHKQYVNDQALFVSTCIFNDESVFNHTTV